MPIEPHVLLLSPDSYDDISTRDETGCAYQSLRAPTPRKAARFKQMIDGPA